MRYIDKINLEIDSKNKYKVGEILFRESACNPCNELYDSGYLDRKDYMLVGNIITKLRYSEYLPFKEVEKIILKLRKFYNVGYYEATYYVNDKVMYFNFNNKRNIVRIFPLEDYNKMTNIEKIKLGIIYLDNTEKLLIENIDDSFNYIPSSTKSKNDVIKVKPINVS